MKANHSIDLNNVIKIEGIAKEDLSKNLKTLEMDKHQTDLIKMIEIKEKKEAFLELNQTIKAKETLINGKEVAQTILSLERIEIKVTVGKNNHFKKASSLGLNKNHNNFEEIMLKEIFQKRRHLTTREIEEDNRENKILEGKENDYINLFIIFVNKNLNFHFCLYFNILMVEDQINYFHFL